MSTPLYDALHRYAGRAPVRFHMPGHVGKEAAIPLLGSLSQWDVTEVPETGSLFDGEGPTALAEEAASRFFGTKATFFSAGGSTLCIQAMFAMACPRGSTVLMDRCIHRSALHALTLLGLRPVWIWRRADAGDGMPGRVDPADVERALRQHPEASAVYVTSPDYYGVLCDIPAIAAAAHRHHVPLLVDGAHGAHLGCVEGALAPWRLGADLTACSAHKTLPALTGAAWLHVQNDRFLENARESMELFGSTSPSYLILLSLDLCREWMEQNGAAAFAALEQRVDVLKKKLRAIGYQTPLGPVDPVRLALNTGAYGISGTAAAEHLRGCGVEPEYGDGAYLITIPSVFHTEQEFTRLERALETMPRPGWSRTRDSLPLPPEIKYLPGEVLGMPVKTISLDECEGMVSAVPHMPCPPAVPVIMPGEVIDNSVKEFLRYYKISKIKVVK